MSFPRTYKEVRHITLQTVLETRMARAIARKAGIVMSAGGPELVRLANSASTFSWMTDTTGDKGYIGSHDAGLELPFPRDTPTIYPHAEDIMVYQADYVGVLEGRLVANVTGIGTANSRLMVVVDDGEGVRGFIDEPPSVPLDEVGLHVSSWHQFAWDASTPGIRLMRTRMLIDNPGGLSGSFYVGFCQFQTR